MGTAALTRLCHYRHLLGGIPIPPGFVPDPNSPAAMSIQLQQMQSQIDALKLRTIESQVLGYSSTKIPQTGISPSGPLPGNWTQLNNLSVSVTVGSNRLLQITSFINIQGQANIGSVQMKISVDDFAVSSSVQELIQSILPSNYTFLVLIGVHAPVAGTHTYQMAAAANGGGATFDVVSIGGRTANYLLVEDIGLAPS